MMMIKKINLAQNIQGIKNKSLKGHAVFPDDSILKKFVIGICKTGKSISKEFIEIMLRFKSESIKTAEIQDDESYAFLKQSAVIFDRKI